MYCVEINVGFSTKMSSYSFKYIGDLWRLDTIAVAYFLYSMPRSVAIRVAIWDWKLV
jgi:hypothetical protein